MCLEFITDDVSSTLYFAPRSYRTSSLTEMVKFLNDLNGITAHGGGDGPEYSISGIERAIRVSERKPDLVSHILVFTDAPPKLTNPNQCDAVAYKLSNPSPPNLITHFFLNSHLSATACYQQIAMASSGSGDGAGLIINSLSSGSSYTEFVEEIIGSSGVVPDGCDSSRKRRSSTEMFTVSELTVKLTVFIQTSEPTSTIQITDPKGSVQFSDNGNTIYGFARNHPLAGTWVVQGSFQSVEYRIEVDFSFDIVLLSNTDDPVYTLTPPGCTQRIALFSNQFGNLSTSGDQYLNILDKNGTLVVQRLPLKRDSCSFYRANFTTPSRPFRFQFEGTTKRGYPVHFIRETVRRPAPVLIACSTGSSVKPGGKVDFYCNASMSYEGRDCPYNIRLTANSSFPSGVGLSVSPDSVALKGSTPVPFQVTATVASSVIARAGQLYVDASDLSGNHLYRETQPLKVVVSTYLLYIVAA